MKVVIYNKHYRQGLALCLLDYYREMYDNTIGNLETAEVLIDAYLSNNYWVYVVIDNDEVIGFMVCYVFNNYGMTNDYLVCENMFMVPSKRSSRATLLLFTTLGHVMTHTGLDCVSTTFNSSKNYDNIERIGGMPLATVMKVSLNAIGDRLQRYKTRLKLT